MSGAPYIPQAPKGTTLGDMNAAGAGGYFGDDTVNAIGDAVTDAGNAIGDVGNSAWDVLSGNRDYRRNKAAADLAWERTMQADNTKVQRNAADLAAAGINPVQAGMYSGGSPSAHASAPSQTSSSLGGAINSAVGVLSSVTSLKKAMAEIPQMAANTRRTNAEASFLESSMPSRLRYEDLKVPQIEANTAESWARKHATTATERETKQRTAQQKMLWPKFAADAAFYKKYGMNATQATQIHGPWGHGSLAAGTIWDNAKGPGYIGKALKVRSDLNTAADVLSAKASERVIGTLKRSNQKSKTAPQVNPGWIQRR